MIRPTNQFSTEKMTLVSIYAFTSGPSDLDQQLDIVNRMAPGRNRYATILPRQPAFGSPQKRLRIGDDSRLQFGEIVASEQELRDLLVEKGQADTRKAALPQAVSLQLPNHELLAPVRIRWTRTGASFRRRSAVEKMTLLARL
jgi:hypothetical protein